MDASQPSLQPYSAQSASGLLEDLLRTLPNETVWVGELVDRLDNRAHGVLLLILALPMCIPNVPGISTIFGVLMLAPAVQMTLGHRRLWLPHQARAWRFKRSSLEKAIRGAAPMLRRVEFLIRPRLSVLTRWPATAFIGAQTLLMGLILILPLWGANLTPGVTVTMTALALLQRDGLLMILSVFAAAGSVLWVYLTAKFSWAAFTWFANWLQGLIGGAS